MITYSFECSIDASADLPDQLTDSIYAAGCDDATVVSRDGSVRVIFDRQADSLDSAIKSAVRDLDRAGCSVNSVELDGRSIKALIEFSI
jgi:hypothetical protein